MIGHQPISLLVLVAKEDRIWGVAFDGRGDEDVHVAVAIEIGDRGNRIAIDATPVR